MSVAATAVTGLLRMADLSAAQLDALLELGDDIRNGPGWWAGIHAGGTVTYLLDAPPTPTGASLQDAAHRLGLGTVTLRPDERDRSPVDSKAIVVSTSAHATLEEIARSATAPVVNASTSTHHPCHALADLLTVRRHFGYLDGIRLAYVGEGDNVAHSLMEACALAGIHMAVATPRGSEPDHDVTRGALALAAEHGSSLRLGHDPRAAVALADVVYAGASSDVDRALMRAASPWAVRMRHRPGEAAETGVISGAGSLAGEQDGNRLPIAQALLHSIVAGGSVRS